MGLPVVRTGNVALDRFLDEVRIYIDAQKTGASAKNRPLTMGDLPSLVALAAAGAAKKADAERTQEDTELLAKSILDTRLFRSLSGVGGALDGLLDGKPRQVLSDVRASNAKGQAAATSSAVVSVTEDRALSAQVTEVTARLDDFDGTASIEEAYLALVDRASGVEAQWTLKVTAGNKVAGIGLASVSPTAGPATSAFIVQADKFAVVGSSDTIPDPANPASTRIPFGVDTVNNVIYINGGVRINAGGRTLAEVESDPGTPGPSGADGADGSDGQRGATRTVRTIAGSSWSDSEANAAIAALGIGTVVLRDEVTLRNSDSNPSFIETRYWSGSGWASLGVVIDGNLLVSGSITADKLAVNSVLSRELQVSRTGATYGSTTGFYINGVNITSYCPVIGTQIGNSGASNFTGMHGRFDGDAGTGSGVVGMSSGTAQTLVGVAGSAIRSSGTGYAYGGVFAASGGSTTIGVVASGSTADLLLGGSGKIKFPSGFEMQPLTGSSSVWLRGDGQFTSVEAYNSARLGGVDASEFLRYTNTTVTGGVALVGYAQVQVGASTVYIPFYA